jgi:hypothetical protein
VNAPPVIVPPSPSRAWWGAGIVAALLASAVLFWFDPVRYAFYPLCLFHVTTGWHCPGCGALRGAHEFLHGHWLTALRLNALVFGLAPLAFVGWFGWHWRERDPLRPDRFRFSAPAGWWVLGALVLFGVLRNIPVYPFTLLAP